MAAAGCRRSCKVHLTHTRQRAQVQHIYIKVTRTLFGRAGTRRRNESHSEVLLPVNRESIAFDTLVTALSRDIQCDVAPQPAHVSRGRQPSRLSVGLKSYLRKQMLVQFIHYITLTTTRFVVPPPAIIKFHAIPIAEFTWRAARESRSRTRRRREPANTDAFLNSKHDDHHHHHHHHHQQQHQQYS